MVPRRNVLVPLERNPLELYLLGLCALSGLAGLFGFGTPSRSGLPPWADAAWFGLLLGGGGLSVAGLMWPDALIGLPVERAGLWPIAAGAGMYAAAVAATGHWLSAVALVGFGLAAAWQAMHITRLLRTRGGER